MFWIEVCPGVPDVVGLCGMPVCRSSQHVADVYVNGSCLVGLHNISVRVDCRAHVELSVAILQSDPAFRQHFFGACGENLSVILI